MSELNLFRLTLCDFYKKLGEKSFWNNDKAQDIALEALGQDYLRAGNDKGDSVALEAATNEYLMRKSYMEVN